jgi:hypothetical protein
MEYTIFPILENSGLTLGLSRTGELYSVTPTEDEPRSPVSAAGLGSARDLKQLLLRLTWFLDEVHPLRPSRCRQTCGSSGGCAPCQTATTHTVASLIR